MTADQSWYPRYPSGTRRYIIVATDRHGREIGRAILRAYDHAQAMRFARRLLVWSIGPITLAASEWDRTLVAWDGVPAQKHAYNDKGDRIV